MENAGDTMCLGECGTARMHAVAILSFWLGTVACAGQAPSAPAGGGRSGWQQLDLAETTLAGTRVFYEKALEPNLPAVERGLVKLRESRARFADVLGRRRPILADLNHILGVTDPDVESQDKVFLQFATVYGEPKLTLYFVRRTTVKDFLRAGGQLPDFSYDRPTDTASYNPQFRGSLGAKPPENWDLALPVPADRTLDDDVSRTLVGLGRLFGSTLAAALHEVTEMTLVERLRPADPYFRWFSDGFANALTCHLMKKHLGPEAAQEFAAANDVGKYSPLEKELNLRYWMAVNTCVHVERMPVPAEAQMEYARYAYAMLEAQRLMDAHGIECVGKIVDAVRAKESRRGSDILEAIKAVTGEEMEPRLLRYQTFTAEAEGIEKYAKAYQTALDAKNYEQMFINVLRIMELRGDVFSPNYLQSFHNAALFLFMMGYEQAGDEVMQHAIELYSKSPAPGGREAAQEWFVRYALACKNPRKAEKIADELLKTHPTDVSSLSVKMLMCLGHKDLTGAQELARQIRGLAAEESPDYKMATTILALDPNQPSGYKKAGEPK